MIVILGPTATGKTKLAAMVAAKIGGEVISADSRQVYRGMDIGTGKDYDDYMVEGISIPYHLIDLADRGGQGQAAIFGGYRAEHSLGHDAAITPRRRRRGYHR